MQTAPYSHAGLACLALSACAGLALAGTTPVGLAGVPDVRENARNLASLPEAQTSHIWTISGGARASAPIRFAGEVYVGPAGDMVLIPKDAIRTNLVRSDHLTPLWLASNTDDPCGDLVPGETGDGINPFLGIGPDPDDPCCPDRGRSAPVADRTDCDGCFGFDLAAADHGDIAFDSLVTGFRVFLGTTEPTPDTDGDGTPDSFASSTCTVAFTDNDNGFGSGIPNSGGVPLTSFSDLPMFGDPDPSDGELAVFTYTYDLTSDFTDGVGNPVDRTFTIGNTGSATDIDGDGLADFGYSYEFEFADTDSDGNADFFVTFQLLAAPEGDVVCAPQQTQDFRCTVENIVPPQGTGATEDIDIYNTDPQSIADPTYLGTITGFTNTFDPDGVPDNGDELPVRGLNCDLGTPYAHLAIELFSDTPFCPADLNGDRVLNNTDINLFVQRFIFEANGADLNDDGNYNATDINLFVQLFVTQCM